jgi:hypothetical protein
MSVANLLYQILNEVTIWCTGGKLRKRSIQKKHSLTYACFHCWNLILHFFKSNLIISLTDKHITKENVYSSRWNTATRQLESTVADKDNTIVRET